MSSEIKTVLIKQEIKDTHSNYTVVITFEHCRTLYNNNFFEIGKIVRRSPGLPELPLVSFRPAFPLQQPVLQQVL